jgi:hypothetical protein
MMESGRVGIIIILISLIVLLIFSLTAQEDQPNLTALFVGEIGLIFGWIIIWRYHPLPESDECFRSLRTYKVYREQKKMKKEQIQGEWIGSWISFQSLPLVP